MSDNVKFWYLLGILIVQKNKGEKKLSQIFKNNEIWKRMTPVEHQLFGKWVKKNSHLLTGNFKFRETDKFNNGIYCKIIEFLCQTKPATSF